MRLHLSKRQRAHRVRKKKFLVSPIESLESRWLLTTTVYIDYGDRFAGGTYTSTVGALDSTVHGTNPDMDGPAMQNASGANYAAAISVKINFMSQLYDAATQTFLRSNMTALAQRFYQGLDVTVVELTSSFQTVNGHQVRAASSFDDISDTLGANETDTKNNDAYVIVGQFLLDTTNFNPALANYGGISTPTDIGALNTHDGTAVVCLIGSNDSYRFNGNQIAHESAHTLGLRHVWRQNTSQNPTQPSNTTATGAQYDKLHQSEMMSYLGYNTLGGFNVFSRYPMVRGDGNTNANTLSATPSPFEAMANDANIGPSLLNTYITGTGENDIISITKTGANAASVSVTAYDDTAYTIPVDAPGTTGNTYTYTIDLTKPLLIDPAGRDDRVVIDGDLGVAVTVRGMNGNDSLWIDGKNAASVIYTPGTNTATGLDLLSDMRGVVTIGATVVNFQEFESSSVVRVINATSLTERTPLGADTMTVINSGAEVNVSGSSGGVTLVPLQFTSVGSFTLDAATNDSGTADNIAMIVPAATSLTGVIVNTGSGGDTITVSSTAVPISINSGGGSDMMNIDETNANIAVTIVAASSSDTVKINNGGVGNAIARFDTPQTVGTIQLYTGGTLDGSALVTCSGTFTWSGGVMSGTGGTTISSIMNVTGTGRRQCDRPLTVNGTATLAAAANEILILKTVTIGASGKLDLNDNDMILDYTGGSQLTNVQNLIKLARGINGTWTGFGLTSTSAKNANPKVTTLGAIEGTEWKNAYGNSALFDNEVVDTTAILVKYTYYGDADFNGRVDFDDYARIDNAFNTPSDPRDFFHGDFNYDGRIDFDDYALIDNAFNMQGSALSRSPASALTSRRTKIV